MGWIIVALPFIGILLANFLPVDVAVRESKGRQHRHGWRELLTMLLLVTYSCGALWLGIWLFTLLKPRYEYGPPFEGYWMFFAVALGVEASYLLVISFTGRWLLCTNWQIAWKMSLRVAMYNLLVLLATWLFFQPNF